MFKVFNTVNRKVNINHSMKIYGKILIQNKNKNKSDKNSNIKIVKKIVGSLAMNILVKRHGLLDKIYNYIYNEK